MAQGVCAERISVKPGLALYGGFAGNKPAAASFAWPSPDYRFGTDTR